MEEAWEGEENHEEGKRLHGAKMKCFVLGCKSWSQKWVSQNLQVWAGATRIDVLY